MSEVRVPDAATPMACVTGWPVAHSRSPLIHRYWLKQYGVAGDYRLEAVPPERFPDFLRQLRTLGYVGANVTIPHKEMALALTRPDDLAQAAGAANTLWFEGDILRSTNTDIEGFIHNLDAGAPGWDQTDTALVLGAGGSSRAIVYGLLDRGLDHVYVANRTLEKAHVLRETFGVRVKPIEWPEIDAIMPSAGLLVNTTSLGMKGQPPLEVSVAALPEGATVTDAVYVPLETGLLAAARGRGLRAVDGLGMLLYQAVRGFAMWFGHQPEVTPQLRKYIEDDLVTPA